MDNQEDEISVSIKNNGLPFWLKEPHISKGMSTLDQEEIIAWKIIEKWVGMPGIFTSLNLFIKHRFYNLSNIKIVILYDLCTLKALISKISRNGSVTDKNWRGGDEGTKISP